MAMSIVRGTPKPGAPLFAQAAAYECCFPF